MRTEAFVWSPLLPPSRRGSKWSGLAHIADWFYTCVENPKCESRKTLPAENLYSKTLMGCSTPRRRGGGGGWGTKQPIRGL